MIHVSDLMHAKRCARFAWNKKYNPLPYESFYHLECPFSQVWSQYLHIEDSVCGTVGDSNEKTLELLKKNKIVRFARFTYKDCRTKIPVLIQEEDGYKAIYPYLSAYPKESEALVMKINQMICAHCGISIKNHEIVYLDKDYVREGQLSLENLFSTSDCLFNRRNHLGKSIQKCMDQLEVNLDEWIESVQKLLNGACPKAMRSKNCTSGRRCIYYDLCFDESQECDDSVLFLTTSREKLHAYEKGIHQVKDLDVSLLEGFPLQYAQVMASRKESYFCDRVALGEWNQSIQYPISYLDFEWDTFALPPYRGMKPFDVLCFQYSLHIEDEQGKLTHTDFFQSGDCRVPFIESLIENVPKTGSILVYNMEGAEKLRLIQLGEQFPKYKEKLEQIYSRMIDLSKPFEQGIFYDNRMRGHYSLKNILPVFSDTYSYANLEIRDGMTAVHAYRTYDKVEEEEKLNIRENIRTYCSMDTFAEYVVYHGLLKILREE